MLCWSGCVKCGCVSAPAFRVTQPICRLSGCSSVATVIGNDGQPELWLKLHRGWPRMTNVVYCVSVCVCGSVCFQSPEFLWDYRHAERGEEEIRLKQHKCITEHLSSNKIIESSIGVIPALLYSCHILLYRSLSPQHWHTDRVTVKKKGMLPPLSGLSLYEWGRAIIDCLSLPGLPMIPCCSLQGGTLIA